jgi:F-type H+-transporting ATPase subunit b
MLRLLMVTCRVAAGVFILALPTALRAEDPKSGGKEKHAIKLRAEGGPFERGARERTFDFSNSTDRKDFVRDAEEGRIDDLQVEKEQEVIPKRFDLGLWSIIIFLVLFFVLRKFAWKPMIEGLHKREEKIRGALEQAEKTRQEAMQLQAKLDAQLREAGGRIAAMMDEARREAQGVKDQMVAEAKAEIQHERDRLKRETDMTKDQALKEIWQQAVALAALMSTKAVRRALTPEDHKRLLDESLKELHEAGAGFGKRHVTGAGL